MNPKYVLTAACAAAACAIATPANAAAVLTFEGIPNLTDIGNFYGPNYVFLPGALALVDSDAGGSGNTANEPSGETTLVFLNVNSAILNVPNGFDTGFSFFYSSNSVAAAVTVYDGLGATGNVLGTINLVQQYNNNCVGDPNGAYCNWTAAGVAFNGIAKSIDFGGTANFIVFDNITFGDSTPRNPAVPEPASWAMMMGGFALLGGAMRRRRTAVRFA